MGKARRVIRQSAVVPYRRAGGQLEVLVITSSDGQRWGVPKGLLEPGLTPAESAAKEALEEAGVRGAVSPASVGTFAYEKWGGTCEVEVFLLHVEEVLDSWEEQQHRTREWLSVAEAVARLWHPDLRAIVRSLPEMVR